MPLELGILFDKHRLDVTRLSTTKTIRCDTHDINQTVALCYPCFDGLCAARLAASAWRSPSVRQMADI
jgi:hypothetical protein